MASEHVELLPVPGWPLQQKIEVAGREVLEYHRYAIRWYLDPARVGDPMRGYVPVLYQDGKAVSQPWKVFLAVSAEADQYGGNANTT